MKKKHLHLNQIKLFINEQNFIIDFDSTQEQNLNPYFGIIETLLLLKRIRKKNRITNAIYLSMLHRKFRKQIQLKHPPNWKIIFLATIGQILGFRI
ncbi:hypothetical protein [Emticicia aquatica]|uniref:hypothetical protein n=1 Tax=Emticicia aquatica TaxID=1681835 RepID=UPI001EE9C9CB|nr:hypothetical protein [Emticicia aquatica]